LPEPAFVHVVVVDTRGRLVRELVERWLMAGPHELRWDGLADSGQRAPSGVYHVRLSVDGRSTESRKVVLVR
jgi:flagellar hook assembly protein FlgD